MQTLPILPSCGQPASIRIEVYSPDPGDLYGSLDASAYFCDLHAMSAVSAIWRAQLTPYKVEMAPDVQRRCGEVYVFPTGRMGGAK
ncbi:hypothetical protein [Micromonospora globispora]|uniref:hypothetical protein n=1 Tax=Micromonospora globispora TaxID=1450148 RepID=UPI000F5E9A6D|nr:hypothetical protein [Micromonospora globispora]RQW83549.1 hypothetical protein DKL51_31480 [Micromonospora globispora]